MAYPSAGHLQQAGHIRYRRGHISALDRVDLEACVYECSAVLKNKCDCLLGDVRRRRDRSAGNHG